MAASAQNKNIVQNNEEIDLASLISKYLRHWPWILIAVILTTTTAFLYLKTQAYVYESKTIVLVKDTDKGSSVPELDIFSDIGIGSKQTNLFNEIEMLKSHLILAEVVKDLKINTQFEKISSGFSPNVTYYKSDIPFKVNSMLSDSLIFKSSALLEFKIVDDNSFELVEIIEDEEKEEINLGQQNFNQPFKTSIGSLTINKTASFNKKHLKETFRLHIRSIQEAVRIIKEDLSIEPVNKDASVLQILYKGTNILKNEDFLNKITEKHEEASIDDKNKITEFTSDFIAERMLAIEKELKIVEDVGEEFKSVRNIVDVAEDATLLINKESEIESELTMVNIEITIAEFLNDFIQQQNGFQFLLPANLGLNDESIITMTQEYNQKVIERNRVIEGSSKDNPLAVRLKSEISSIQKSLMQSLDNFLKRLNIQLQKLESKESEYKSRIAKIPGFERKYREIARQQEIKEALYLYLLQKREENQIAMASSVGNLKVLDPASTKENPVSPKKKIILLGAFLIGILIPTGIIYINSLLDNKVRRRDDLEHLGIPIAGEIPENKSNKYLVVEKGGRSMVAEAFRMLRANISFLLPNKNKKGNIIFLTSTIAGEGKTFNAVNLANSFALTGKKVVLVGMDLRAPKVAKYAGIKDEIGISNYVVNEKLSVSDITFGSEHLENLYYIHSGAIPPNPSELLLNSRISDLFKELKEEYDYIIVDTAPTALVADTNNIAEFADIFLYVVRANKLNTKDLEIPRKMKSEKQIKNMAFILNATKFRFSVYKGYGYGYVYGDEKKSWFTKFTSKFTSKS